MDSLNNVMVDWRGMRFIRLGHKSGKLFAHKRYLPVDYATHDILADSCTLECPGDFPLRYPPELELAIEFHCHFLGYGRIDGCAESIVHRRKARHSVAIEDGEVFPVCVAVAYDEIEYAPLHKRQDVHKRQAKRL